MRSLDRIRDFIRHDRGDLKILLPSLLLAFSVWLVYNLTLNYTKVVSVPVVARSNITGRRQLSAGSATVLARCHTRGFDLIRLGMASEKNPIVVEFDASDLIHKSDELFYITSLNLEKYSNAIFGDKSGMENYVTDTLYFRFPPENHKRVPVVAASRISYHPQYISVSGIRLIPDSVTLYGEPAFLDRIDRILTKPVTHEDLKSTVHGEVRLETVKGIRMSSDRVNYHVDVLRYVDIPARMSVETLNLPAGKSLMVYPRTVDVVFRCAFPVTRSPGESCSVGIDYLDFQRSSTGKCIPQLSALPEGVLSYSIEPAVLECIESDGL